MSAATTLTAFLTNPDDPSISNPIHSSDVARQYGFEQAIVGGASVYAWCARTIIEALGDEWLERGWADISFRRPVYPGDQLTIAVDDDRNFSVTNQEGHRAIVGVVGPGEAPFLAELTKPSRIDAGPAVDPAPPLTLASAPIGIDFVPMGVDFSEDVANEFARDVLHDEAPPWAGAGAVANPGWLAARPIHFIKHNVSYGPSIHARSHIQHLATLPVGSTLVVAGRMVDAYERNGHHYAVTDCLLLGTGNEPVAQIRHTNIFRVAARAT